MTEPSPPNPLNPPKQSRSRRTLERIVRAALEILEEEGAEGLSVQAIVERAESSVGSFYARFSGKEELLAYLGERAWREATAKWDDAALRRAAGGRTLAEVVRGAVLLLGDAMEVRGSCLRALRGAPGSGGDAYSAFQAHVLQGIEALILARADEMAHPEPEVGVRLGLQAVVALLDDAGGAGRPGTVPMGRRVEEATLLLLSYLGAEGVKGGEPGQVDFFDVWS